MRKFKNAILWVINLFIILVLAIWNQGKSAPGGAKSFWSQMEADRENRKNSLKPTRKKLSVIRAEYSKEANRLASEKEEATLAAIDGEIAKTILTENEADRLGLEKSSRELEDLIIELGGSNDGSRLQQINEAQRYLESLKAKKVHPAS